MVERVFATSVEAPADGVNKKAAPRGGSCAGEDLNLHDRNGH
jgi:hypothetical protein